MPCEDYNKDCAPCQDCPEPPAPVLPRCDNVYEDGVYTNVTITVQNGCIFQIESGEPVQYMPDPCCASTGSGGGGGEEPCICPPGADGENATIEIGTVNSVAFGQPARVQNVGTDTHAILDFDIPRGQQGETGESQSGIDRESGGIQIEKGVIKSVALWPPALAFVANAEETTPGFIMQMSQPDTDSGTVTYSLNASGYDAGIRLYIDTEIYNLNEAIQAQIAAINATLQNHEGRIAALEARLP